MSATLESQEHTNLVSLLDVNQHSLSETQVATSQTIDSNVTKSPPTIATQESQKSYDVTHPPITTLERADFEPVTRKDLNEVKEELGELKGLIAQLAFAISDLTKTQLSTPGDGQQHKLEEQVHEQLLEQRTAVEAVVIQVSNIQDQFTELKTLVHGPPNVTDQDQGYSMAKDLKNTHEELTGVRGAIQRLGDSNARQYEDLRQSLSQEARHYVHEVNQLLRNDLQADIQVLQGRLDAAEAPGGGSSTEQVSVDPLEVVRNTVLEEYHRLRSENQTLG